jgi:hypothetical protein
MFYTTPIPVLELTQPPIRCVAEDFTLRKKKPKNEVDYHLMPNLVMLVDIS